MSLAADLRSALDPAVLFKRAFGFEPLDWQVSYLRETRPTVVLKGRQTGASTAAAALAIHEAVYGHATNTVIVSPSLKQSAEILGKARTGLRNLGIRLVRDSASKVALPGGARILSLPGTARSVRGWTAQLLVLDEAAYIEAETWTAARALVATGGRLVVQSTPAVETGDFYELATGDDPAWARYTVRSDEVPTISAEFLESERRTMSPDAYASEYEGVFGKAGASLFTLDQLAGLILPKEGAA